MPTANIKVNGEDVVVRDVTDVDYVAPQTGFVIHLDDLQARRFIREELTEIRDRKSERVLTRDAAEGDRLLFIERRDAAIATKDAENAVIDDQNDQIAALVDFLTTVGDPTE